MSQPSVASFFNTRKHAAPEDVTSVKNKRLVEPPTQQTNPTRDKCEDNDAPAGSLPCDPEENISKLKAGDRRTRSGRTIKRIGTQQESLLTDVVPKKISKIEKSIIQPKLVQFIKKGPLSHRKQAIAVTTIDTRNDKANDEHHNVLVLQTPTIPTTFALKQNATNVERGMRTPTKQIIKGSGATPIKPGNGCAALKSLVKKELNFDEVKTKLSRSAKLQELKASLNRIQELEKTRKTQEERNRRLREGVASPAKKTPVLQLKKFDTIEVEVLTSPAKVFKTPTKLPPPTPDKNELMSPRHTNVSKRIIFSPAKNGSPSKMVVPPAYQRFKSLAETSKAGQLPLPFKYRHLIEIFKGLDSVCAMFHNRKECITFKKLKPAVQRMVRKNFTETHLAQIKNIYPEAFIYTQMKMRNYGSTSKADYFQLVIAPNVENMPEKQKMPQIDEENILASAQKNAMNPHVMTERLQKFQRLLLERVKDEHDKFLRSLDPPLLIPKDSVTRWHPEFDLENCTEIERAHLPQPPNVEKYSSAHDILSTARNLFNCATPLERAMERYEAKMEAERIATENLRNSSKLEESSSSEVDSKISTKALLPSSATNSTTIKNTEAGVLSAPIASAESPAAVTTLLKGVPKALLEKIRARQAAKALDAITRRPSQDQEATKYSRLPELARHLRNLFISEKKGVLTLEVVIKKIQNSFRASLTPQEIESHLKLIAKEVPEWVSFHEVRNTMYLKINKDKALTKVIERLEAAANEKSK